MENNLVIDTAVENPTLHPFGSMFTVPGFTNSEVIHTPNRHFPQGEFHLSLASRIMGLVSEMLSNLSNLYS